ncbi:MAG TPA: IclR family transcriptional regulator, partial [Asticcacaulis sp.]|nr:IclR family transcriptional regulator [Asticcacaulis sp.]
KGFSVIELLADHPQGLTISEITARMGLSMSEIFRVIMVMEKSGWLKRSTGDRFRVTTKVIDLALRATPAEELIQTAAPLMRDLVHRIDQSCHLVVRHGDAGLIIYRQQNPGPMGFSVRTGIKIPLEESCSGRILLSFNALDDGQMPQDARRSPATEALLQKIRARGYEVMKSARTIGVTDISYPIFGARAQVLAALTVPFLQLIDGTQTVDRDEARALLEQTAARISEALGNPG